MASTVPFTLDTALGPASALTTVVSGVAASGTGVVLVPPFGWDEVCSYRDRRALAATLAAAGHAVVRLDLPGTGDSSGTPHDSGLVATWQRAIAAAAVWLREERACRSRVIGLGIGSGGLLAASTGVFDELVLWGTPARGRRVVRELRALQNLEVHAEDAPPDAVPEGALLSAGYLLTAETLRDLEALEAGSAMGSVRRALLLGRGEAAPDARLVEALQATGVATDVEVGPGWTALQADPDHPASDEGTFARIARWLESGPAATVHQPPLASEVEGLRTLGPVTELATHLAGGGFAVITQPVAQTAAAGTVVFVGAGAVRHTGPNRMWVEAARRLAASGYPSARIDLPGIGEADGDHPVDARGLYSHERQRQVSRVLSDLRGLGLCGTFALVGLCSGGYTAFHAVADEPDVGGACLLNPNLLDDTVDPDEALRAHAVSGQVRAARSVRSWRRLVRGEIPLRTAAGMLKVLGRKALERPSRARGDGRAQGAGAKWASIRERGRHVTVVFASAEPLERAWAASGERERVATSPGVHIVDVPHAGHTFRPLWAQREVLHAIEASVRTILGPVP